MKINGDRLVEALSLPSHDKRVLDLLKDLGLKRPVKDENYDYVSIILTDPTGEESFEIDFDEDCKTEKQKSGAYGNIDFYLNGIAIHSNSKITPPFEINWDDDYQNIKAKIGKRADFLNKYGHKLWLLEDSEKKYLLNVAFLENGTAKKYTLLPYNEDRTYVFTENKE